MSEIVEEIVGALNSIITDILDKKGILKAENVITNTNESVISNKKDASLVDASKEKTDGSVKTQVVNDASSSQDTIIDVAPNEIIETQETYTIEEDGKITNVSEPSKKNYSL